MQKILVVDDEKSMRELLTLMLKREGYRVVTAGDGPAALEAARSQHPSLVVLDWMLPGLSGVDVCRALRQESNVPIVMLTARAEESDKLVGLELGADDYVTKPFSPRELVARVRAVLRRSEAMASPRQAQAPITVGDVTADPTRHQVTVSGRQVDLTPTEFALLAALIQSPGRVFTRLQLLDQALGESYEGYERTVDAHIKNLRQKLEADPARPKYVLTVYGVGYKFAEPAK